MIKTLKQQIITVSKGYLRHYADKFIEATNLIGFVFFFYYPSKVVFIFSVAMRIRIQTFGKKNNLLGWYSVAVERKARLRKLAEIQTQCEPLILSEIKKIGSSLQTALKKHRDTVQIPKFQCTELHIFLIEIISTIKNCQKWYYPVLEIKPTSAEEAEDHILVISDKRWYVETEEVDLLVFHNGKKITQVKLFLNQQQGYRLRKVRAIMPGDFLEILFKKNNIIIDRVTVNIGTKQYAAVRTIKTF